MKTTIFYPMTFALLLAYALLLAGCAPSASSSGAIRPGELWTDDAGRPINAHGGGVLYHNGTYYWYGEYRSDTTFCTMVGVNCYSSRNLVDWKYEGVALPVSDVQGCDIQRGCILERPKVVYNAATRQFVMWFHLELKGQGYRAARAAVAVSDTPVGPYTFLRSGRVNPYLLPMDLTEEQAAVLDTLDAGNYKQWWTPAWRDAIGKGLFLKRDLRGGQMSRDMALFVDTDGKAYHIYSSEDNLTIQIAELSDDYLWHTGRYVRVDPGGQNEAPAIFLHDGTYWMICSGCTGWEPNEARMFSAPSILGPWTRHPNPCAGADAGQTFGGQGTYVLPLAGKPGSYIFMADVWRPKQLSDSRYIWLPISFHSDGIPYIEWRDSWVPGE